MKFEASQSELELLAGLATPAVGSIGPGPVVRQRVADRYIPPGFYVKDFTQPEQGFGVVDLGELDWDRGCIDEDHDRYVVIHLGVAE